MSRQTEGESVSHKELIVRRMHFVYSFIQTLEHIHSPIVNIESIRVRERDEWSWKIGEQSLVELYTIHLVNLVRIHFEKDDEEKMTRQEIQTKWSRQRRRRKRKFTILRLKMFVMQYNPIHWNSWLIDFFKIHVHIFVSTHELKSKTDVCSTFRNRPFLQ